MGNSLNCMKVTKERRILILGLDAAGKTTILYKLTRQPVKPTPTIGYNAECVKYKNMNFYLWDVGGTVVDRPMWRHYYFGTQGLIFVVDCADRNRITEARREMRRVITDPQLRDVSILIFANKEDHQDAIKPGEIVHQLGLTSLARNWYVQSSCATTGDGLFEGLTWLQSQLKTS